MWAKKNIKSLAAIIVVIALVLGLFLGLELGLHTSYPALTVISPSMYIDGGGQDYVPDTHGNYVTAGDVWLSLTHPFTRTLSVGDIVIVEGVNPKDLNANYPNSNIIIFHSPEDYNELIVHRIIGETEVNGTLYFLTKGDGNGNPWPQQPTTGFDPWDIQSYACNPPGVFGVPQNYVVGKVIFRIPWLGWATILLRDNPYALPVLISIIAILIIAEYAATLLKPKEPPQKEAAET